MNALDRKLFRDLRHLWGQGVAIALVVACGIAIFVAMQSNYESLKLSQTDYYSRYRFAQVFAPLKRAPESIAAPVRDIPGVAQVATRVVANVTLDVAERREPISGRLISIPERQAPLLNDLFIRQGRYIEPGHADEVLISEAFATANQLQPGDHLGAIINGRWQLLQVVGIALSPEYIYEIREGDIFPDNERFGVLWMGREALGNAFQMDGAFNNLSLTLLPGSNEAEVIFRLDKLLAPYGGLGAYGRDDQISARFIADELTQLRTSGTFVPAIFLGIGAFLLHIVLARLIGTQRDQIAVLKAFGYSNWTIGGHFLKFVLVIVAVGEFLGIGVGIWLGSALTKLYGQFYHFPLLRYEASGATITSSILIGVGAAILGAFIAVRKTVTLPPAEAMRPEPPARFRQTFIERLGLQRWLPVVGRIILRNVERKPTQSLLTLFGIALAVALLVVGGFSRDAQHYIVDTQFRVVQRDDITIAFNEPRPARTRYELMHLPGVLYAEPFRTVAVRLRFEHRSEKIAITGLAPGTTLRRLVDRRLEPISVPPDGLLLTDKLAQLLGVQPGESLTVEVLEGEKPIRTVPVTGLADEPIGLSAYMDIHALNRLLREGGTISGAFLAVDQQQVDRLYKLLKETPAIASVAFRQAAVRQFQETVGQSQGVIASIQTVFACIIAFGVVYNSARIALSERGRELATLRIVGFSRAQVAVVLLGEQAILTLIAVPLGFVTGYGLAALLSQAFNTKLYRFPLVVTRSSYAFAFVVIAIAALVSGWLVRRQSDQLDLIAVLKTRE